MSEEMKGEFETMCNLSQAIEDKGFAKGIEMGRAEATFQTTLANIQSLINTLSLSAEKAMDALNIPQDDRKQYLCHLKPLN